MSHKFTALSAAAALLGGVLVAQGVAAQQTTTPPSGAAPQAQPGQGQSGQGMMGGMGGMMGQMDPAQMNRMMENCNKMMESMMQNRGGSGTAPSTPTPGQRRG
ncbi:MAG TPA: hypothetical protein VNZ61_23950 [Roseomonas sp.]|nr:hypothetical protein [Roseomonas sp.]